MTAAFLSCHIVFLTVSKTPVRRNVEEYRSTKISSAVLFIFSHLLWEASCITVLALN